MKKLISLFFLFSLYSCQEKFNPNEFKGTWIHFNDKHEYSNLISITFQNDSVYLEDIFTYNYNGKYKISRNFIEFYLKKDTLKYNFIFSRKDSILKINNNNYMFLEGFSEERKIVNYDLINLKINQNISSDSLSNYESAFHLFKNQKNSINLKLNDKVTSDFSLIQRFAFHRHRQIESIVMYIGENIKLKEIIKCYVELYKVNINKVFLLTHFDLKRNNYNGFLDNYEFWQNQINELSREKIKPIKSEDNYRKGYLRNNNPKIIILNKIKDISLLDSVNKNKNLLIQINSEMSLETYIYLKNKIASIKKSNRTKIRTEFINL